MSAHLRLAALAEWERWMGVLYEFGGKLKGEWPGPFRWEYGVDCSGYITAGIYVATRGKVDLRVTWNADKMHKKWAVTMHPKPGDVAVYGTPEKANHVMVWYGDGRVLGACGGYSETDTPEEAMSRGARVRYRSKADYRKRRLPDGRRVSDFLGFRVVEPLDT